ncbi:MAG: hypothetical protein K1X51_14970 [Rhodospirillaceae bacterium]|nr:hypothetical protein [Rhodospirillaceae bacterium]
MRIALQLSFAPGFAQTFPFRDLGFMSGFWATTRGARTGRRPRAPKARMPILAGIRKE